MGRMKPYHRDDFSRIFHGDSKEVLALMKPAVFDSCVTDPPYELGFMGRDWDGTGIAYDVNLWKQVLRTMKPGAYLCAFGASRNYHRMAVAIEDAGFEIRDSLIWMYGSGFPKGLNISKAFDKANGAVREKRSYRPRPTTSGSMINGQQESPWIERARAQGFYEADGDVPITDEAIQWDGWNTCLKPAFEPIVLAQKPFSGKIIQNIRAYGVGGLNIDGTRVGESGGTASIDSDEDGLAGNYVYGAYGKRDGSTPLTKGRYPANVVLSCSCNENDHHTPDCPCAMIDAQSGIGFGGVTGPRPMAKESHIFQVARDEGVSVRYGDIGGASRFFYTAKASRTEREHRLELSGELEDAKRPQEQDFAIGAAPPKYSNEHRRNVHTTVKPVELIRWLMRLVTPPGGTVLDPFLGSGTARLAAFAEGMHCVGIDIEEIHCRIASQRG